MTYILSIIVDALIFWVVPDLFSGSTTDKGGVLIYFGYSILFHAIMIVGTILIQLLFPRLTYKRIARSDNHDMALYTTVLAMRPIASLFSLLIVELICALRLPNWGVRIVLAFGLVLVLALWDIRRINCAKNTAE